MKKYSKLIAFLTTLVLCLIPFFSSALTASAEGPVTHYLKYVPEKNEWRYQTGSVWEDWRSNEGLDMLKANIKDGDLLVIDGNTNITLAVDVHLNNLTIVNSTIAVISAKSIENFYAINNSVSAINGDVKNAYIYDASVCNFNNNVSYMELVSQSNTYLEATISVVGTLNHLKATAKDVTHYEFYNFTAGSLVLDKGQLKTSADKYSKTPQAITAPTTPSVTTPSTSAGNEYDDVPKTGDITVLPILLIGIAVVCLMGSRKIKHS